MTAPEEPTPEPTPAGDTQAKVTSLAYCHAVLRASTDTLDVVWEDFLTFQVPSDPSLLLGQLHHMGGAALAKNDSRMA